MTDQRQKNSQNPQDWRSGMSYLDLGAERTRQTIYDAYQNIVQAIEANDNADSMAMDSGVRPLGRTVGGLDKSAAELAGLLQTEYTRRYHDDGCPFDDTDAESGGHNMEEGCEESDGD